MIRIIHVHNSRELTIKLYVLKNIKCMRLFILNKYT